MANQDNKIKQQVLIVIIVILALLAIVLVNSQILIEIKEVDIVDAIILDTKMEKSILSFIGHPERCVATLKSGDIIDEIDSVTVIENKVSGDTMPVRKVILRNKLTHSETYRLLPVLDENGFVILD